MAYTAGSASISVVPDLRNFHRTIGQKLKEEDKTFAAAGGRWASDASRSFAARFDPKAKVTPKVDSTKAKTDLDKLAKPRTPAVTPKVDDTRAKTELDGLARRRTAPVKADVDDRKAEVELDHLARTRTAKVKVDVDTSKLSGLSRIGSMLGSGGGASFLSPGALAGLAAAVPLLEAGATEAVALASGLTGAGIAAGSFAALAVPSFKSVTGAYSAIQKDQKAYDSALTKTGRNTALKKLHQDWANLDPAEAGAVRGLQGLESGYSKLAKAFQPQAMKVFNDGLKLANTLLPDLVPFANTFAGALDKMLKKANAFAKTPGFKRFLQQMNQIAQAALPALASGIAKVIPDIERLLTIFSAKDDAQAITIAFGAIDLALRGTAYAVNRLRTNWDSFQSTASRASRAYALVSVKFAKMAADGMIGSFKTIVHGAAAAFGWVPGLGGKLKAADRQLAGFKTSVDANFNAAISTVSRWGKSYRSMPKVAHLKGDISDLQAKLRHAEGLLRNRQLTATKRARIQAVITDLQRKIAAAKSQLASLHDRTVYINAVRRTFYTPGKGGHVPGTGYASGTPSAARGWAWVGERGPELMRFTGGEQVIPAGLSAAVSRGFADGLNVPAIRSSALPSVRGGDGAIALTIGASGNDQLLQAIVRSLRADIRANGGGNVQAYLGKGGVR